MVRRPGAGREDPSALQLRSRDEALRALAGVAGEAGYTVDVGELDAALQEAGRAELGEDALERLAGGTKHDTAKNAINNTSFRLWGQSHGI